MYNIKAQNLGDSIINWVEDAIQYTVSHSGDVFNAVIGIIVVALLFYWGYIGFKTFKDVRKRHKVSSALWLGAILVGLVILGPIGKIVYNIVRPEKSQEELDFLAVEHKFYYNQSSKVADCLFCGAYVLEDHTYCTNCGTQNRFKCKKCGTLTDYDDLFCFHCGENFGKRNEEIFANIREKKLKAKELSLKNKKSKENTSITPSIQVFQAKAKEALEKVTSKSKNLVNQAKEKATNLKK